jgi:O-antigen ligase
MIDAMSEFFGSGYAIDLVIAVLAAEALLLWVVLRRGHLLPLPTLLAGLGLLIAWRIAHSGGGWIWIALPLSIAGLAHGWDLWQRWPRQTAR